MSRKFSDMLADVQHVSTCVRNPEKQVSMALRSRLAHPSAMLLRSINPKRHADGSKCSKNSSDLDSDSTQLVVSWGKSATGRHCHQHPPWIGDRSWGKTYCIAMVKVTDMFHYFKIFQIFPIPFRWCEHFSSALQVLGVSSPRWVNPIGCPIPSTARTSWKAIDGSISLMGFDGFCFDWWICMYLVGLGWSWLVLVGLGWSWLVLVGLGPREALGRFATGPATSGAECGKWWCFCCADPLQLQQVSTIDALQGGECDFLIFSATRSNATGVKLSEKPTNQTSLTDIDGFSEEFMFATTVFFLNHNIRKLALFLPEASAQEPSI